MSLLLPVQIQGVHIFGISVTKLKLEMIQFDLTELDKSTIRKIKRKKLIHFSTLDESFSIKILFRSFGTI